MNKEFVPYEIALKLEEIGFDEPFITFGTQYLYRNEDFCRSNSGAIELFESFNDELVIAPTFAQAFKWLLKKHSLYAVIIPTVTMHWTFKTMTVLEGMVEVPPYKHVDATDYSTYEEAETACLKKLIEIVKLK